VVLLRPDALYLGRYVLICHISLQNLFIPEANNFLITLVYYRIQYMSRFKFT